MSKQGIRQLGLVAMIAWASISCTQDQVPYLPQACFAALLEPGPDLDRTADLVEESIAPLMNAESFSGGKYEGSYRWSWERTDADNITSVVEVSGFEPRYGLQVAVLAKVPVASAEQYAFITKLRLRLTEAVAPVEVRNCKDVFPDYEMVLWRSQ
jgi:hypothetical protein